MGKLFLFTFLGLLMVVNATVENYILDNAATLRELKNLDMEEEDSVELSSRASESPKKVIVNVDASGAVGDGVADDTQPIQNSQQMHFVISHSDSVLVSGVEVSAPADSPNTDGIHITGSTNVVLQDTTIGTGDDCISIVNGSSAIKMKKITCGPGHGISIGSLGKDGSTGIVTKVVLDSAVLKKTTNGLRIKTWQGGNGYVEGVSFSNVKMQDVANPIIIDQNYCDSPTPCSQKDSAVQISKIMYRNISGTTKSKRAMSFDCSEKFPCTGIVVNNIELESKNGTVEAYCHFATGLSSGVVQPSAACLEQTERRTVHTEL